MGWVGEWDVRGRGREGRDRRGEEREGEVCEEKGGGVREERKGSERGKERICEGERWRCERLEGKEKVVRGKMRKGEVRGKKEGI